MGIRTIPLRTIGLAAALACAGASASAVDVDVGGYLEPEIRYFTQEPSEPAQTNPTLSLALQLELSAGWDRDRHQIRLTPFVRVDAQDDERTHADLREALYIGVFGDLEVWAGLGKVFWGVTESVHVVDIINQTDLVENVDGEDKLGQPMLRLSYFTDYGTFTGFVLPYFRERTFPGRAGRPRLDIPIDTNRVRYESDAEEWHTDFALRWKHFIGDWDIGLAHFHGTGREPVFQLALDKKFRPRLIPFYPQIDQTSIDVQATKGAWLYKLEAFNRFELDDRWIQAAGGVEYTIFGIYGAADLGLVAEYAFDERGGTAPQPFNNDLFAGLRWSANDAQSTAILAGGFVDLDTGGWSVRLEADRRIGDAFVLSLEAQVLADLDASDPLAGLMDDDFVQLRLARFF